MSESIPACFMAYTVPFSDHEFLEIGLGCLRTNMHCRFNMRLCTSSRVVRIGNAVDLGLHVRER